MDKAFIIRFVVILSCSAAALMLTKSFFMSLGILILGLLAFYWIKSIIERRKFAKQVEELKRERQNNAAKMLILTALFSQMASLLSDNAALAQKKVTVGDFIESKSNNTDKRNAERKMNYQPEGRAFVCENGTNRFTRALYGGYTDYRVETSDRPVFASVKKGHHRNISFRLEYKGMSIALDSTDYCRAVYNSGMRFYYLKDKRWGDGTLRVEVVAPQEFEGGIWRFTTEYFEEKPVIKATVSEIANPKLHRNGDIGADKPGVFEAAKPLQTVVLESKPTPISVVENSLTSFFAIERDSVITPSRLNAAKSRYDDNADNIEKTFNETLKYNEQLANRIVFSTPDLYINTLGGALVMAADGDWDGETWLHGCVGWRMPLAGWRAGFLGDALGWDDRAVKHFDAYANSQVTNVEPTIGHPSNDPAMNLARAEKKWGTQMYSNGYVCRNPNRNDQMHHYDMNLNYMDELLWHFQYNADTAYMRKMWPVITRHLAWEKRNFDPDGDHLYDAYCCIWASDALYYNGGAVTHSSAYNYRGNLLASRIAELIGEDGSAYKAEAEAILKAMNERLWIEDKGHWAEYQDLMGLKRVHESAALWSIYTPIDCGAGTQEQFYRATDYVNREIPHIKVEAEGKDYGSVIATSNWLPYSWSINNVAPAEEMHTALAFFKAGRTDEGYALLKANIMDNMYLGESPGNFGQISFYDAARGECYRDFGDCTGISARALLQGLFGIVPEALYGRCVIRPGFPKDWDYAAVKTPYLSYEMNREGDKLIYKVKQNFPQKLTIIMSQNTKEGQFAEQIGTAEAEQTFVFDAPTPQNLDIVANVENADNPDNVDNLDKSDNLDNLESSNPRILEGFENPLINLDASALVAEKLGLGEPETDRPFIKIDITQHFNSEVDDIFKNEYLSPRPPYTTLQIPTQGIGEWCHPTLTAEINDSVFRTLLKDNEFTMAGVPFASPKEGNNIVYTSLWDNYPNEIAIDLSPKALKQQKAHTSKLIPHNLYLLMAGSTNHMQCHIANAVVKVEYSDGSLDSLVLSNPDNWCPIEQDYYVDNKAFQTLNPRPYRVALGTGMVSRDLGKDLNLTEVYGRPIPGGAAQMLKMPLDGKKKPKRLTLTTLSNDVVIGLMAITLQ